MLTIRRIRYAMVLAVILIVGWFMWQARGALIPFLVGGILAYILAPLVERLSRVMPFYRTRRELARTLAIILVYVSGLGALVATGSLIIPAIINETSELIDNIPTYVEQAQVEAERWTDLYRERVPIEVQQRIEQAVQDLGASLGAYGEQVLARSFGILQSTFGLFFGYIIIPFWLFYILKDRHRIGPAIKEWFPPGLRSDVDHCIRIIQRVLGSYIRAQLILGLFIGTTTTLGLFLLGVDYFIILGIIAGITELIPIIGPILGAIPALIVVVATEPEKTIWVLLFYIGIQQLENVVLVPRIQGNAVEMHPALIIVLLAIAQQVAGFGGMLVAVPLAAVSRDLFKYIYSRLQERETELANERTIRLPRPVRPAIAENGATDRRSVEPAHADGAAPEQSDAAGAPTQELPD
ncbi:MAG: AI-2E family transporter [Dehalococcoidia bacterium]